MTSLSRGQGQTSIKEGQTSLKFGQTSLSSRRKGVPAVDPRFDAHVGTQFDFSQTDRFFQESTGQTLSTASGDVIGLAFDQSQWGGATLAAIVAAATELLTNPDMSSATGWTLGTNWTISGGKLNATGVLANSNAFQPDRILSGRMYRYAMTADNVSGSSFKFLAEGGASAFGDQSTPGTYIGYLLATTNGGVYIWANGTLTAVFDNASVKSIPGTHATQSVSSYRPKMYSGWARFDGVDDNLPNGKVFGSAGLVLKRVKLIAKTASTQVMMGVVGAGGTDRFYDAFNSSGQLTGRIGNGAAMTIPGDLTGTDIVVGLGYDGTTATLLTMTSGGILTKQTQSQSGAPNTVLAPNLGGYNNNGAYVSPAGFDLRGLAWFDAMPSDAQIKSYAKWMFRQ